MPPEVDHAVAPSSPGESGAEEQRHQTTGNAAPHRPIAPAKPVSWGIILLVALAAAYVTIEAWRRPHRHTPPGGPAVAFQWPDNRVDINRAPAAEFTLLPGIGEVMAMRIVADREQHGPFSSVDNLRRVPGIGERTIERVRDFVVCDPPDAGTPTRRE